MSAQGCISWQGECAQADEQFNGFLQGPVAARLAQMLPQAQRVTIAGAGHLAPMERPAETAAALLDFLERCPS